MKKEDGHNEHTQGGHFDYNDHGKTWLKTISVGIH